MSDTFTVVCGKCQVGADAILEDDGDAYAVCPSCGQRDKVEDAQRIAGEHFTESVKAELNATLSDFVRGSKIIKFTSSFPRRSDADFRWHAVPA